VSIHPTTVSMSMSMIQASRLRIHGLEVARQWWRMSQMKPSDRYYPLSATGPTCG
jgi:hypothetical protein